MANPDSTPGKAPAFQFYPKDFLSDSNVVGMSMQERGVYITLICICWQDGFISSDVAELARKCSTPVRVFQKIWPAVERCFRKSGSARLVHPRLEREREKQAEYRRRQSDASHKRWQSRGNAEPMPEASHRIPKPGTPVAIPHRSSAISNLRTASASADSSQVPAAANARSGRPLFKGTQFVVFEFMVDDLRRMLGRHFEDFDIHAWFFALDEKARDAGLIVPQRDGGKWLQSETLAEAIRRGLPVAATAVAVGNPKTAGNQAAAARFIARGQQ